MGSIRQGIVVMTGRGGSDLEHPDALIERAAATIAVVNAAHCGEPVLYCDPSHPRELYTAAFPGVPLIMPASSKRKSVLDAVTSAWKLRYQPIVLIPDTFALSGAHYLAEAARALAAGGCDVVLGPAAEGGWTLLGFKFPERTLIKSVDWCSSSVAAETEALCASSNLSLVLLPKV